ncbi:MAG: hypothetical protein ACRED3_16395, partial [Bradyrhizobium sp.]
ICLWGPHLIEVTKMFSKLFAAAGLSFGLAIAALSVAPSAWAAGAGNDMHGVDLLNPGAQFSPQIPMGLSPSGSMTAPASSRGGALSTFREPLLRQNPETPNLHPTSRTPNFFNDCTGAPTLPSQQIGSDETFCGLGGR